MFDGLFAVWVCVPEVARGTLFLWYLSLGSSQWEFNTSACSEGERDWVKRKNCSRWGSREAMENVKGSVQAWGWIPLTSGARRLWEQSITGIWLQILLSLGKIFILWSRTNCYLDLLPQSFRTSARSSSAQHSLQRSCIVTPGKQESGLSLQVPYG